MKLFYSRTIRIVVALSWMIFLSVLLLLPELHPVMPGVQAAPPSLEREILFSSMHLLTFAFTAGIWLFALDLSFDTPRLLFALAMVLVAYGLTTEYLQTMVPGRSAQWWDMLANSIGIVSGWLIWQFLVLRHNLKQSVQIQSLFR